ESASASLASLIHCMAAPGKEYPVILRLLPRTATRTRLAGISLASSVFRLLTGATHPVKREVSRSGHHRSRWRPSHVIDEPRDVPAARARTGAPLPPAGGPVPPPARAPAAANAFPSAVGAQAALWNRRRPGGQHRALRHARLPALRAAPGSE